MPGSVASGTHCIIDSQLFLTYRATAMLFAYYVKTYDTYSQTFLDVALTYTTSVRAPEKYTGVAQSV